MESFTLPPSQPVGLLKDGDMVRIHRKGAPFCAAHQQAKLSYSPSFDTFEKIAPLGIKTFAIEEFERETGGYESEQEEEKGISKDLFKDGNSNALKQGLMKSQEKKRERKNVERNCLPSSATHYPVKHTDSSCEDLGKTVTANVLKDSTAKSKEKKRKWDKIERVEEQGREVVPYMGGATSKKERGKNGKKRKLEDHQVDIEKLDSRECQLSRGGQNSDCSKAARIKGKKKDKANVNNGNHSIKKCTEEKQILDFGSKEEMCLVVGSSDEEVKRKEKISGVLLDSETVKKLSRSTIRKKAKRRWKQENAKLSMKATSREDDDSVNVKKAGTEKVSLFASTKPEDDGDAEEERLPRVVRPGHIRFQNSDEDGNDKFDPQQNPLPYPHWSHGISKRKGQSWGQEKTKRGSNSFHPVDDLEFNDIQELEPEALPAVEGTPQNGDVIVYRILELTRSCCPELSEYHVGRVLDLENQSGRLKLAEVPNYRIQRENDQNPPIFEDAVLETEISSLAEVRLVERSKPELIEQALTEIPVNEMERKLQVATDTATDVAMCNENFSSAEAEQRITKSDGAPFEGWVEISDALQRKRQELERQVETTSGGVEHDQKLEKSELQTLEMTTATRIRDLQNNQELSENIENTQGITPTRNPEPEKQRVESSFSAGKGSSISVGAGRARGWHRKAGGLGATMALLRSQI
ncbi:hypothetical protein L7F22_034626 [Adiantum nelumboides]|nr:hypothetical protein [Adiantum nelumboides]